MKMTVGLFLGQTGSGADRPETPPPHHGLGASFTQPAPTESSLERGPLRQGGK